MNIVNSIFTNNTAYNYGGSIFNGVNGTYNIDNMSISSNVMNGNRAGLGNEVYNMGNITVLNLTYLANTTIKVKNGNNILLFVNLTDDIGNLITGQNISFYVNGIFIGNGTVIEGKVNLTYRVNNNPGIVPVSGTYGRQ
ncbi:hypothetical protein ALNOE001_13050 [Candidatus Methanobinarius endosymbioticus]|uniref:Uncharacterized protein n=1 Tax=Candidatus Methanobinarius endosymbioticus TaxID=2006182 RepID=A0A366M9Y1_9EURY|nr:hypothetical protein ALNOE001_13050 [Candidatus Methanobinarius endosymbioticus]